MSILFTSVSPDATKNETYNILSFYFTDKRMEKFDLSKEQTIFPEPRLFHLESIFFIKHFKINTGFISATRVSVIFAQHITEVE